MAVGQGFVQFLGAEFVDQGHRALGDLVNQQEAVIHRGDHIDNGVAQSGDIVFLRHETLGSIKTVPYGTASMFASVRKALSLVFDPAFRGLVMRALLYTVLLFAAGLFLAELLIAHLPLNPVADRVLELLAP